MPKLIKYNRVINEYEITYKAPNIRTASWLAQKYQLYCNDELTIYSVHQKIILNSTKLNLLKLTAKQLSRELKALKEGRSVVDVQYVLPQKFSINKQNIEKS